jgi:titin
VTGYRVVTQPGGFARVVSSKTASTTITGLTNGTEYSFTVSSISGDEAGEPSSPSNSVVPADVPIAPPAPSASTRDRSATVSWAKADANGSPITGYTITTSPGGATKTVDADTTSTTIDGLTNGTAYTFTVNATNAIGTSPASAPSNEVTPTGVPAAPAKPSAQRGDQSTNLTWVKPDANGSPITGYTITTSPSGATKTVDADTTSTTIDGLTNGTAYTFTVNAINAIGTSPESVASNEVTPAGLPASSTLRVTRGDGLATLRWSTATPNGSPITGYRITYSDGTRRTVGPATTAWTATGLTNGRAYSFTVAALNEVGAAAESAAVKVVPAGRPKPPGKPTVMAGKGVVTIGWKASANNGAAITSYKIRRSDGVTRTVRATARSYKWTGLKKNKRYSFKVYAVNSVGTSTGSINSTTVKVK